MLAIIRRLFFLSWGGGFLLFLRSFVFRPPLRLPEIKQGEIESFSPSDACGVPLGAGPFLPGPYRLFGKYLIDEFGDDPEIAKRTEQRA